MIAKTKTDYHISLGEAKRHLKLRDSFIDDDLLIQDMIYDAVAITEAEIQKDVAKTTNVLTRIDWGGSVIRVNEGNLISITSITTTEDGGSPVTLSNYNTYVYRDYFTIDLDDSVDTDLLTVNFLTGYDTDALAYGLRRAILIKLSDLYDVDRASSKFTSIKDSGVFERLCAPYRAFYVDCQSEN